MSGKVVMDAVAARLAANWTDCAIVENDTVDSGPADGSAYVTVEYPVAVEDQITIGAPGANVFRESGAFRIKLVSPSGDGMAQPMTRIEQLRSLFRSKQFGSISTYAPSPAAVDPQNYRGGKSIVSFSVPYFSDLVA